MTNPIARLAVAGATALTLLSAGAASATSGIFPHGGGVWVPGISAPGYGYVPEPPRWIVGPPRVTGGMGVRIVQGNCSLSIIEPLVGEPAQAAEALRFSLPVRIFTPNMMNGTMDYRPERLNAFVGTNGLIGSVRCG